MSSANTVVLMPLSGINPKLSFILRRTLVLFKKNKLYHMVNLFILIGTFPQSIVFKSNPNP